MNLFRASPRYLQGVRHYELTGNPDGQRTITIDITPEESRTIEGRDLSVSIALVKTPEEQLREARLKALALALSSPRVGLSPAQALAVIERVDAEFAEKERHCG